MIEFYQLLNAYLASICVLISSMGNRRSIPVIHGGDTFMLGLELLILLGARERTSAQ